MSVNEIRRVRRRFQAGRVFAAQVDYSVDLRKGATALMMDTLQSKHFAQRLRVLAEPERLLIIQALRDGPKSVSEIGASIEQKIGNVSHHLKVLREAGLVESERDGRFVRYRLAPKTYVSSETGLVDHLDIGCCRIELPKAT